MITQHALLSLPNQFQISAKGLRFLIGEIRNVGKKINCCRDKNKEKQTPQTKIETYMRGTC